MSANTDGEDCFSVLLNCDNIAISREVEPFLIEASIARGLNLEEEDYLEHDTIPLVFTKELGVSFNTFAIILKAFGFINYSLIRSSKEEKFFNDVIIVRK